MIQPPAWSDAQLVANRAEAIRRFQAERIDESAEAWRIANARHEDEFRKLFSRFTDGNPATLNLAELPALIKEGLGPALRYLAAPPISDDDLIVLAQLTSLAPGTLAKDSAACARLLAVVMSAVDYTRLPWLVPPLRPPTAIELEFAVRCSAQLLTAQRVATDRRSQGKNAQESAIRAYLTSIGLKEVAPRAIKTMGTAPSPGEFCGESIVGTRKADIVVRLHDQRLLAIECKVSNSALNSVKRLNNDAAQKAVLWLAEFGTAGIVPMAALSGVFAIRSLKFAQDNGLKLIWAHSLTPLGAFIDAAR